MKILKNSMASVAGGHILDNCLDSPGYILGEMGILGICVPLVDKGQGALQDKFLVA